MAHVLTLVHVQMTKDSRTLSLEIDTDSQTGTPRDLPTDRTAAGIRQASLANTVQPSEG